MAELVLGVGVPHTPYFPRLAEQGGSGSRIASLFNHVAKQLGKMLRRFIERWPGVVAARVAQDRKKRLSCLRQRAGGSRGPHE